MPGIPLLFTDTGGPTDFIYHPLPGLFLDDDLYLGDDIFLDDGPTLYARPTNVSTSAAAGITTITTATPTDAIMPVPGITQPGGIIISVTAARADALMPVPGFAGQDLVVSYTGGASTDAFMPVPQFSGFIPLIIIPSVRELPPLRVTVTVETPGGRFFRWSEDDPNPVNTLTGLRFSDTVPGGFENMDCTLPRKPNVEYSDLERLSTATVKGAGGSTAWEGRIERVPRTSGNERSVSPSAVGWQAHLEDDKSVTAMYVDRDLNSWRGASATRKIGLDIGNFSTADPSVDADATTGKPRLNMTVSGAWSAPRKLICEAWFDAGPNTNVAGVWFTPVYSATSNFADSNWNFVPYVQDGDGQGVTTVGPDLFPSTVVQQFSPSTPRRFAAIQWYYNTTPAGADGFDFTLWLQDVAVMGDQGLSVRTDGVTGGFYASDIIYHAVAKYAPALNVSYGNSSSSIQQSTFVIGQAAFRDRTTVGEIVRQVSRFGLEDWGVWDNRTFYFTPRGGTGKHWRARVGPAQLEETGPQVDRLWESVIVQYQDVDGSTKTVGPPGSAADNIDPVLKDDDPDNPINRAGIIRRAMLTAGTLTPAQATEIGRRFLEEQKQLDSSGRAVILGHVESDRGVMFPYHAVRAGDTISFIDAADSSPRRVVRSDKDHSSRTCSVDLDAPPEGMQALLERLGVGLVDLGFS